MLRGWMEGRLSIQFPCSYLLDLLGSQMISVPHAAPAADVAQAPFSRVAPTLRSALIVGAAGGFTLATVLTLAVALHVPEGLWWRALAQAHGFLQLYGWAGLFALG